MGFSVYSCHKPQLVNCHCLCWWATPSICLCKYWEAKDTCCWLGADASNVWIRSEMKCWNFRKWQLQCPKVQEDAVLWVILCHPDLKFELVQLDKVMYFHKIKNYIIKWLILWLMVKSQVNITHVSKTNHGDDGCFHGHRTFTIYACLKEGEGCLVGRGLQPPCKMPLHPSSQEVMFFIKWCLLRNRGHKSQHHSLLPVATLHSEFKPSHLQDKLIPIVSLSQNQPFLPFGNKILASLFR